jgi:hypothetical protein
VTNRGIGWLLFALLVVIYNSNGREIQSYDTQPTKYAARELALHGTLTLDYVIATMPPLAERMAFQRDRWGHWRSAYSVVPSIEAAIVGSLLHVTRIINLRAPLAPAFVAALTASLLTAGAVALVFVSLARVTSVRTALLVAIGLGLGTNLWPLASRTLWQFETMSAGSALAMYAWLRRDTSIGARHVVLGASGLALAGAARLEIAPAAAILVVGLVLRIGLRRAWPAIAILASVATAMMTMQWIWFGHVLGAKVLLQQEGFAAHGVTSTFNREPWIAAYGLLASPSRGLFVFSPVAVVAIAGMRRLRQQPYGSGELFWAAAAIVQFVCYCFYSMWWGGHTYGPRYLMDALIPLSPAAALGVDSLRHRSVQIAAGAALVWSIVIAGTGAFVYANDQWNTDPDDVDTHVARVWDWRDAQFVRSWNRGPSPQNFSFTEPGALRLAEH